MMALGRWTDSKGETFESGFGRDGSGMPSDAVPNGVAMTDEDFERFLEMLERSNPQAFRELMERDRGWA